MAGVFGLEVVTPEQSLYAGGAASVVLSTSDGDLTVLDGHTPLVGDVVPCTLRIEEPDGTELLVAVHGGFVQVDTSPGAAAGLAEGDGPLAGLSTRVTVLAGVAELAGEIDLSRAELARELATQRVHEFSAGRGPATETGQAASEANLALAEAQDALTRAELRLSTANRRS